MQSSPLPAAEAVATSSPLHLPLLSIVIPIFNESENLPILRARLREQLEKMGHRFEVILVNDCSTDGSDGILRQIAAEDKRFKVIEFRRNSGQTAAMMAGIDYASGDVIIPMDGDLQNDPVDIPRLLAKLDEGYDVVSGWRKDRKDHELGRNLPSRIANWLISTISGVHLHDYGCSLKAYRKEVIKDVRLYGEMHRFIPIYASWQGGRVTEIPVNHHPRLHGVSKYGLERVVKVILDLIVVKFLARYSNKPIYVFGVLGLGSLVVSLISGILALYLKLFENVAFIQTPLPLLVVMTFITGLMTILMGLLAEMVMRTYHESQNKPVYLIRSTINFDSAR